MLISTWECKCSEDALKNFGTEEDLDYEWVYYCNYCEFINKRVGDKEDCKLLNDITKTER